MKRVKRIVLYILALMTLSPLSYGWFETKYDTVVVRWDNGNLKEQYTRFSYLGNEKGFSPHGQYRSFYQNGALQQEGFYQWNKKFGAWITWDSLGNRLSEVTYCADKKQGLYIGWGYYNLIHVAGYFLQDRPRGLWYYRSRGYDLNNPQFGLDSVVFLVDDSTRVQLAGTDGKPTYQSSQVYLNEGRRMFTWDKNISSNWFSNSLRFYVGTVTDSVKNGFWLQLSRNGAVVDTMDYIDGNPEH